MKPGMKGGLMAAALALTLGLSGCGAPSQEINADRAEVCATRTDPPKRVDDQKCATRGGGSSYGFYSWQLNDRRLYIPPVGDAIDTRTGGSFDAPRTGIVSRVNPKGSTVVRGWPRGQYEWK